MTRIVCLDCLIKAHRNQSWGQDLQRPLLCSWHPNEATQTEKSEVTIWGWLGTWVHREGETGPKSHMESAMWARIHSLPRSKQCPTATRFSAVSSCTIRLCLMWVVTSDHRPPVLRCPGWGLVSFMVSELFKQWVTSVLVSEVWGTGTFLSSSLSFYLFICCSVYGKHCYKLCWCKTTANRGIISCYLYHNFIAFTVIYSM